VYFSHPIHFKKNNGIKPVVAEVEKKKKARFGCMTIAIIRIIIISTFQIIGAAFMSTLRINLAPISGRSARSLS
jgi:hypothetical protein